MKNIYKNELKSGNSNNESSNSNVKVSGV